MIPTGVTVHANCAPGAAVTGIGYLRVVVAVTWTGARCPPTGCSYVTSTLLSTVDDPLFTRISPHPLHRCWPIRVRRSPPSATPSICRLTIKAVPSYRVAITAGTLPAGLILDTATGQISGTPAAVTASAPLTLTLTDGFGRVATASFSWTVLAGLTTTAPPPQASLIGTALALTLPAATGGSPGYTWSDPAATLPPGLAVSTVERSGRHHRHADHPRGVPGDVDRHRLDHHPESHGEFLLDHRLPTDGGQQSGGTDKHGQHRRLGDAERDRRFRLVRLDRRRDAARRADARAAPGLSPVHRPPRASRPWRWWSPTPRPGSRRTVTFSLDRLCAADRDLTGQPERDGRCGGVAATGDELPERAVQLRW